MSLWWTRRDQLDKYQVELIENLPLRESFLVLGPPGSGKTNVLLRRAQFVRTQDMPNVLVLTFTRSLTEFVKTGCLDAQGREIFPRACIMTLEAWLRWLYIQHNQTLPPPQAGLADWKRDLALGSSNFRAQARLPQYDALFIDEAQDLMPEEVAVVAQWSPVLFFVGDDRQKIFEHADGLSAVRSVVLPSQERVLPFHYRVAPEICRMADRILVPHGGSTLESTEHYQGPTPATISKTGPLSRNDQLRAAATKLKDQIRVYGDLIRQGDRLGVIVPRKTDRETVFRHLEQDSSLKGRSKIIRAKDNPQDPYDPSLDPTVPICILTIQGCKGLEFRAVHWLFCEELSQHHHNEHYYTVVTRAKTSLDLYFGTTLPQVLARAYSESHGDIWG